MLTFQKGIRHYCQFCQTEMEYEDGRWDRFWHPRPICGGWIGSVSRLMVEALDNFEE